MSTNSRAHLLANLRTGGVRSANIQIPHTAAPSVSAFHIPDQPPMTAAVNGSFQQPYSQSQAQVQAQAQVFQMQMMQMEIMRLQALQQAQQAQQYQVELARQQQQQNFERRSSHANEPATAGPAVTSFPRHRASQAELLKSQLHLSAKAGGDEVPQTAALGGKFGGRLNPHATSFRFGGSSEDLDVAASAQQQQQQHGTVAPTNTPSTANFTTVISGGTPLGLSNGATPTAMTSSGITPSKSDTAMNWRRGNNSVLNGNRAVSVNLKITPPAEDRISPPPVSSQTTTAAKSRPVPLRFSVAVSQPLPAVAIDTSEGDASEDADDMSSSSSNKSDSSPTTPRTSSSSGSGSGAPPLTPREEASKRLYEGLGLGRPAPQSAQVLTQSFSVGGTGITVPHTSAGAMFPVNGRTFSQPMRQPRGPPSGADELGPKNFATRIRRKAIGGLGAMLDARVGRREVEAF